MAKSIKKNFIYNIILNVSKVIFPLITAPYVSRVLEPDGVGLFNFSNTYANWFALFAALGIPYYGIREIAKIKDDVNLQTQFVSEIISISAISTVIFSVILLLSLLLIPQLNENYIVFLVASIVLYFTPLRIEWYFSGKEEFGYIAFRSLLIKILSVILLFLVVKTKNDLINYVALFAVSVVANDIWNFYKLNKLGIHPYFTLNFKHHIKPLLVLFSSSIALYVYTALDTLMLGFLSNYTEVGYYNCATHLSKAMVPIVTSLSTVALPKVAQYYKNNLWEDANNLLNKSFSLAGYLSFPISFGIMAVSTLFVPLFFGEQFYGSIIPLQIITLTIIVIGYSNITGIQILLGFGLDNLFLYSIISGTITSFILDILLIPLLGAVGAAISSVCAELMVLLSMLFFVYKFTPIRFHGMKELISTFVISFLFLIITNLTFSIVSGWIGILIACICCSITYFCLQYVCNNRTEKEIIQLMKTKYQSLKARCQMTKQ